MNIIWQFVWYKSPTRIYISLKNECRTILFLLFECALALYYEYVTYKHYLYEIITYYRNNLLKPIVPFLIWKKLVLYDEILLSVILHLYLTIFLETFVGIALCISIYSAFHFITIDENNNYFILFCCLYCLS